MKKFLLLTTVLAGLPVAALYASQWYRRDFGDVPEKRMVIEGGHIKAEKLVRGPAKGAVTIKSPRFTITFEGESWTESGFIKAPYKVDGRFGGFFPPDPFVEDMGSGFTYVYSSPRRESVITFKKHRIVYCDYLNTLEANGHRFSTAEARVQLWISKQGTVNQPTPQAAGHFAVEGLWLKQLEL